MAGQDRERLEERFFSDTALFDELAAAEDDLVDDYLRDRLPAADRRRLDEYYLASPERAAKVSAARQLQTWMAGQRKEKAVALSWWERLAASLQMPAWALGTAAAALLVAAGSWLVLMKQNAPPAPLPPVAQQQPQQPAVTPPTPTPPVPPPAPAKAARPALFAFTLLPGATRGAGDSDLQRVQLPTDAIAARMTLGLEQPPTLSAYRVAIETVEGRAVWQGAAQAGPGNQLRATVPVERLRAGDYLVRVTGGPGNESVADYSMRIVR